MYRNTVALLDGFPGANREINRNSSPGYANGLAG